MFRDEYAKIGTDSLPPGHSFDIAARARQDAALAAILNLPEHEGPCGASINVREIQEAINKLKYGKASGVDCISTDLLKVCAGNRHMLVSLRKNGKHSLRDYTRFAPPHDNCPMRVDVAGSWGTSYPGRSKIRCIVILLLFRSSGWAS